MPVRALCLYLLALAAALAYSLLFFHYRLNVPYLDDMNDILDFILQFTAAPDWRDRLVALYEPQNNHRTSASRLIYLAAYHAVGTINFTLLAGLANLAWLALAGVYARLCGDRGYRSLALCLAMLVLASPRAYVLIHWPMAGSHFFYLMLCTASVMLLLQRGSRGAFAGAVLLAVVVSFVGAAGLLVWFAGACYLGCDHFLARRPRARRLLAWIVLGVAVSAIAYQPVADIALPRVAEYGLFHSSVYFLALLGSVPGFGSSEWAVLAGLGLLFLCALRGWRDLRAGRLAGLHFMVLFLLAMAAAVAVGRADYTPLDYALISRYSIISLNLLVCLLLLYLPRWRQLQWPAVLVALLLCLANYAVYGPAFEKEMNRRVTNFNRGNYPVYFRETAEMNRFVQGAIERGVYTPPPRPQPKHYLFSAAPKAAKRRASR